MIENPLTNRIIIINGPTYNKLINDDYVINDIGTKLVKQNDSINSMKPLWLYYDIINMINEFITDFKTLYNLHRTCKKLFMYKFKNVICRGSEILINIGTFSEFHIKNQVITNDNVDGESLFNVLYNHRVKCGYNTYKLSNVLYDHSLYWLSNLTKLDCDGNDNYSNILLLNLPNLTYLDCGHNHNFTASAFKSLTSLTYLNCGYNKNITDNSLKCMNNLKTLICNDSKRVLPFNFFAL
jgi:hypothetical protein